MCARWGLVQVRKPGEHSPHLPSTALNVYVLQRYLDARKSDLPSAPHLKGYRQKDYFIATQGPLAHTVEDFWRMVWEWKCHAVVMLTELQEREQVRGSPLSSGSLMWLQWLVHMPASLADAAQPRGPGGGLERKTGKLSHFSLPLGLAVTAHWLLFFSYILLNLP